MQINWRYDKANSCFRCSIKAGEQYNVWAIIRVRADCTSEECDWRWTAVANDVDGGVHAHDSGYAQTEVLARQQAEVALTAIVERLNPTSC